MTERRKTKRRFLLYYARVFNATNLDLIGNLVDITPDGFMLVSEKPLPVDDDFRFKIELSEDIATKSYIEFAAKSMWSRPDIDPSYHNTGFQITEISPEDVAIISRIVELYGFRDN